MLLSSQSSENKKRWILLILFGLISFIGMIYHEPWRDEYLAYTISLFSHNLFELFQNSAYEGHPKLWFIILFAIKQISTSIFLVQVVHWLISLGTVYLLLFKSKIQTNFLYLIPFGYFFIYEYSAIFRNYAIGIFLIFLALTFYQSKKYSLFVFFLALALWSNVNCFIIGCSLFLFYIIQSGKKLDKKTIFYSILFLINILTVFITTLRPKDVGIITYTGWKWEVAGTVLGKYTTMFFMFPEIRVDAWNTTWFSYFKGTGFNFVLIAVSLLLFIYFIKYFSKISKNIVIFFVISSLGMYLFFVLKYVGFFRHIGFEFIILIICLWLSGMDFKPKSTNESSRYYEFPIYLILFFQIASGLYFIKSEYQNQFSQSKKVVEMLEEKNLNNHNIISDSDYIGVDFCAMLKKPIYYCNLQKYGTYTIWNNKRFDIIVSDSLLSADFNKMKNSIFINSFPVKDTLMSQLDFLGSFEPSICGDENFFVYRVKN